MAYLQRLGADNYLGREGSPLLSRALCALALISLLFASGCGAAAAGLVLGILSTGSSDGSPNEPPAPPVLESATRIDGDRVLLRYEVRDDDGGPLDVLVEWQPEDGSREFRQASEYRQPVLDRGGEPIQSHGTKGPATEPGRRRRTIFVWDARSDTGKPVARVRIRITAFEGTTPSPEPEISEPFWAGNEPAEVTTLEVRAASGVIPIALEIHDSTFDP